MDVLSKVGLIAFADMMTTKGWINPNTGAGYKAALNKILGHVADDENVRSLDVKTLILRYNNLHPGELSPASLKQYEKRVSLMIAYFISWKEDPTNFKPPARQLAGEKPEKVSKPSKSSTPEPKRVSSSLAVVAMAPDAQKASENEQQQRANGANWGGTTPNLSLPFPIRPDYLAQIVIPRDMTKDEATRLCTFIQALAV